MAKKGGGKIEKTTREINKVQKIENKKIYN